MSKLKFLVPIVALSLPVSVVAAPAGLTPRSPDYIACKKAIQKHFNAPRRVDVKDTYWVKSRPGSGTTVLVNAKFNRQPVRGTCDVSARGRVAELTVTPGRFVNRGKAVVAVTQLID